MSRKRNEKYDNAVALYNSGLSIGKIASCYGITRQAMYKILRRRNVVFRPSERYGEDNHFYRGGLKMEKYAQNKVWKALKCGALTRQSCQKCGANPVAIDGRSLVQAHHEDYSKPLDVIWFCQKCHHEEHKNAIR